MAGIEVDGPVTAQQFLCLAFGTSQLCGQCRQKWSKVALPEKDDVFCALKSGIRFGLGVEKNTVARIKFYPCQMSHHLHVVGCHLFHCGVSVASGTVTASQCGDGQQSGCRTQSHQSVRNPVGYFCSFGNRP